jgi:hypothetical protein
MLEGFVLGAETFRKKIKDLAEPGRETSGKQYLRKRVPFQEMVRIVEKIRGAKAADFINTRGDWGRPLLMLGCRLYCGLSLRETGEKVGNMDYAAVSMMLRRFEKRMQSDPLPAAKYKALKKEMLNVETCPRAC